jgi:hypothetical protein
MSGAVDAVEPLLGAGFTEVRSKPLDMAELVRLVAALAGR